MDQYFIIEAAELLQTIENNLLSLFEEKTVEKVHTLMRSAHTIKGSAAHSGLDTIQTIAHHLEDVFEALYPPELEIDQELASLLIEAYQILHEPLSAVIGGYSYDETEILSDTATLFAKLQEKLGDFFGRETPLPTAEELGFDVVGLIFNDSVPQDLEQLEDTIATGDLNEIKNILTNKTAFFAELGNAYNLPGILAIAKATQIAISHHPDHILPIAQAALADFKLACYEILNGDRSQVSEISADLLSWLPTNNDHLYLDQSNLADLLIKDQIFVEQLELVSSQNKNEDHLLTDRTGDLLALVDANNLEIIAIDQGNQDGVVTDYSAELLSLVDSKNLQIITPNKVNEDNIITDNTEDLLALFNKNQDLELSIDDRINDDNPITDQTSDLLSLIEEENLEIIAANLNLEDNCLKNNSPDISSIIDAEINAIEVKKIPETLSPIDRLLQSISSKNIEPEIDQVLAASCEFIPVSPELTNLPSIRVPIKQLDQLNQSIGELVIDANQQHLQAEQINSLAKTTAQQLIKCQQTIDRLQDWSDQKFLFPQHKNQVKFTNKQQISDITSNFDLLEINNYSDLHLLLQSLTDEIMDLGDRLDNIAGISQQFRFNLQKHRQLLSTAQNELLEARMVPVATVFNRLPRLLQQMINSHHKPAQLQLSGSEVLIDKAVAEKLYDPLLHLLRNAYDHGLETSEERIKKGKSPTGQIFVKAYHQGNRTTIEVSDDGKGIDWEKIRTKTVNNEILTPIQAQIATESELAEILFTPGFSTSDQVNDLSGRGIGLDIVRNQIDAFHGLINVRSTGGNGTSFSLQIPLSLTTARLLLCEAQGKTYAFLSNNISQVILPRSEQIESYPIHAYKCGEGNNQKLIPIYQLTDLLAYQCPLYDPVISPSLSAQKFHSLLMIENGDRQLCLSVSRVLVEQELVIKSLGYTFNLPSYTQGYTVLADGNLSLVIDPLQLVLDKIDVPSNSADLSHSYTEQIHSYTPKILIVDDSIVQRQSLSRLLTQENYQVILAGNGLEALKKLQEESTIDLIICDVEMPQMNGFEFLGQCRQDEHFSTIPKIMVTTRTSQKHRQLAMSLGAMAYITKPYGDRELLNTISTLIKH